VCERVYVNVSVCVCECVRKCVSVYVMAEDSKTGLIQAR